MTRTIVGSLIGIGVITAIVIAAMGQLRVSCQVCITHRGQMICESARAVDREHAVMQASSAACSRLSGGVTDVIQCGNTPPTSTRCSE